jgi:hypothetical protein
MTARLPITGRIGSWRADSLRQLVAPTRNYAMCENVYGSKIVRMRRPGVCGLSTLTTRLRAWAGTTRGKSGSDRLVELLSPKPKRYAQTRTELWGAREQMDDAAEQLKQIAEMVALEAIRTAAAQRRFSERRSDSRKARRALLTSLFTMTYGN